VKVSLDARHDAERAHHDAFYRTAVAEGFFESEGFRRLIDWNLAAFRRAVPLAPGMRVLSIGSGLGHYEVAMAGEVAQVIGIDISATAVEAARERARARGVSNVEFRQAASSDLVFTAGFFDLVYSVGVFHHLPRAERALTLAQAHHWLTPRGWLYLRDPNARGILRRTLGPLFRRFSSVHTPDEVALDPGTMLEETREAGFVEARIDYIDLVGGPLPWLVRARSPAFWRLVFAVDRAWIEQPRLAHWSSQFALVARRP